MGNERNAIFKQFNIENENFKILNLLQDEWKIPSYTAELSKRHFVS
jgi:hypothetical protein